MLVALTAAGVEIRGANATECGCDFCLFPRRFIGHRQPSLAWARLLGGRLTSGVNQKIMGAAAVAIAIVPSMGLFVHVA